MHRVQHAVQNWREHDARRNHDQQAAEECVAAGEQLPGARAQRIYFAHAAEQHRCVQERVEPIHALGDAITDHADRKRDRDQCDGEQQAAAKPAEEDGMAGQRCGAAFEAEEAHGRQPALAPALVQVTHLGDTRIAKSGDHLASNQGRSMPAPSFDSLRAEYTELWRTVAIRENRIAVIDRTIDRIVANKSRYVAVAEQCGVPWGVIATIHNLEAGGKFTTHLHNGDPLTAKTVQVPKGRPPGNPPFTWEVSALDALEHDGLTNVGDWSVERAAYAFEKFNGMGYRQHHPGVKSPYLWSFTTHYTKGKYVADGAWSDTAVSQQIGAMALIKRMAERSVFSFDNQHATAGAGAAFESFTRAIARGDQDTAVVMAVQAALNARGARLQVDGHFGEATENAVRLFQARSANAYGEPLVIDGVVGPQTWLALTGTPATIAPAAASALALEAAKLALAEEGVREDEGRRNRGTRVDEYVRVTGRNPVDELAWCTCFIYWSYAQAARALNVNNPVPQTAGVHDMWQRSQRAGLPVLTPPQARAAPERITRGAGFFIDTGGGYGHAGLVLGVENGRLETIEGNTNDNGSREGIGVFRRNVRSIRDIDLGFVLFG
jgi:lysozyme family protein